LYYATGTMVANSECMIESAREAENSISSVTESNVTAEQNHITAVVENENETTDHDHRITTLFEGDGRQSIRGLLAHT